MVHKKKVFKSKPELDEYLKKNDSIPAISLLINSILEIKNLEEASLFCEDKLKFILEDKDDDKDEMISVSFGSMDLSGINHPFIYKKMKDKNFSIADIDKVKAVLKELSHSEMIDEEVYYVFSLLPSQRLITNMLISIKKNIDEEIEKKKEELLQTLKNDKYQKIIMNTVKKEKKNITRLKKIEVKENNLVPNSLGDKTSNN